MVTSRGDGERLIWPAEGDSRAPYWIYTDEALYRRELERIFEGPTWSYVALECEIPEGGDYKRSAIGEVWTRWSRSSGRLAAPCSPTESSGGSRSRAS